ncbi:MAG: hypothetical protein OEY11_01285 [Gammaproteobacteria bacterium]|nr:hypothetical protein [Gammaproteobacteria bacterium]
MNNFNTRLVFIFYLSAATFGFSACSSDSTSDSGTVPDTTVITCPSETDTDGDGLTDCFEMDTSFTLPTLADTDGDGRSDGYEYDRFDPAASLTRFNPRIADIPQVTVQLNALPQIELNYQTSNGTSSSIGTSFTEGSSESIDISNSNSISSQVASSVSVNASVMVGAEGSFTGPVASATFKSELTVGFGAEITGTYGTEVNWSQSETQEKNQAYTNSRDLVTSEDITYTDGDLTNVNISIHNTGHVAYKLSELFLTVQSVNPVQPTNAQTIGALKSTDLVADIVGGSVAGPYSFSLEDKLTVASAERLLRSSDRLVIKPASFVLTDINDTSLLLRSDDINALTANITIDYGINSGIVNSYNVAVQQVDGSNSISINDALSHILMLDIEEGSSNWNYPDTGVASTGNGLLSIGNTRHNSDTNQFWQLALYHSPNGVDAGLDTELLNVVLNDYDLSTLHLSAGDKLVLTYVGDQDRDGLNDRSERELGTNETLSDSDSDGLSDALELFGWQSNLSKNPADCLSGDLFLVTSDPLNSDSDGDGDNDQYEYDNCANPAGSFNAIAGADSQIMKGSSIKLIGSAGNNSQNITLAYRWDLQNGRQVKDKDGNLTSQLPGRTPEFTVPDAVDTLVFELVVTDQSSGEEKRDTLVLHVLEDPTSAVFVGALNSDELEYGTMDHPYADLAQAVAENPNKDIYVMADKTYTLSTSLAIKQFSSLYGGYNADWVRDMSNPAQRTNITYSNNGGLSAGSAAISFNNISGPTWLSGFNITSSNPGNYPPGADTIAGDNSTASHVGMVAVYVKDSPNGHLTISDNEIRSGDVYTGKLQAIPGSSYGIYVNTLNHLSLLNNTVISGKGGHAADGMPGAEISTPDTPAGGGNGTHLAGGAGGATPAGDSTQAGGAGGNPLLGILGFGQSAAYSLSDCGNGGLAAWYHGEAGEDGCDGSTGGAGQGANENLGVSDLLYGFIADAAGEAGTNGSKGFGGGGGGSAYLATKEGGGGGGEGGNGGTGGAAAIGGGASIALWLNAVSSVEINGNSLQSAAGGIGGDGGAGGAGNQGAAGSRSQTCVTNIWGDTSCNDGGNGGLGGVGGTGGKGGSGAGGPSVGIFITSTTSISDISANTINAGDGGLGGCHGCAETAGNRGASLGLYYTNAIDRNKFYTDNTVTRGLNGWADQPAMPLPLP